MMRKDDRYETCADELSSRERERLFDDHSDNLRAEGVKRLKEALEGSPGLTFLSVRDSLDFLLALCLCARPKTHEPKPKNPKPRSQKPRPKHPKTQDPKPRKSKTQKPKN